MQLRRNLVGALFALAVVEAAPAFKQAATADAPATPATTIKAPEVGQCAIYKAGTSELTVCTKAAGKLNDNQSQVEGLIFNSGESELCNLKLKSVNTEGITVEAIWPDWTDKELGWEKYFNTKQVLNTGITYAPAPGVEENYPFITVATFANCANEQEIFTPGEVEVVSVDDVKFPDGQKPEIKKKKEEAQIDAATGDAVPVPAQPAAKAPLDFIDHTLPIAKADEPVTAADAAAAAPVEPKADAAAAVEAPKAEEPVVAAPKAGAVPKAEDAGIQGAGKCEKYTQGNGELVLCIKSAENVDPNIQIVKGFLYNSGNVALCDVKLKEDGANGQIQNFWPDWAQGASYKVGFNAGQLTETGLTVLVDQAGAAFPTVKVDSFKECDAAADAAVETKVEVVPLEEVKLPGQENAAVPAAKEAVVDDEAAKAAAAKKKAATDADGEVTATADGNDAADAASATVPADDAPAGATDATAEVEDEEPAVAAPVKKGKGPQPLEGESVPSSSEDYDHCKVFKKDQGEVTLCLKNAKAWNDKKMGRVVQTNLVMINTGEVGLCNITISMENMEKEVGDHYPVLIDEFAFDTFPRFPMYYAPGRMTLLGASIPKGKGVPSYSILDNFVPCQEGEGTLKRNFKCSESTRNGGALKVCVYSDLKQWKEDGDRYVSVEGFISNVGKEPTCNINLNVQDFDKAKEFWGEWMPTFPYTLAPGSTVKFAANIPFETGFPKVALKKYETKSCAAPDAAPAAAGDAVEVTEAAPAAAAKPPARLRAVFA